MNLPSWAILLSFATWRVSSLFYVESSFGWFRSLIGVDDDDATGARTVPDSIAGKLLDCFWCLSLVVAFAFSVITFALTDLTAYEALIVWLASAGGALCIDVRFFARLRN